MKKGGPPLLRRSSTHRNIGNGSEHTNGDHDDGFDLRRASSVGVLSEEDLRKKAEVDSKVASYVSEKLERMRSNENESAIEIEDELETTYDGA